MQPWQSNASGILTVIKNNMKIKKILLLAVTSIICLTINAQTSVDKDYTPQKGDITLAATVGYNSYTSITAPSGLLTDYELAAISTNWSDKKLMVGFESGWFFRDTWKLNLGGGINFTNSPGYTAVPGTIDEDSEIGDGSIPNYRAVADSYSFSYNVFTGIDKYYKIKSIPNLMMYSGIRIGFAYGLNEMKYDEPESMGKSDAETWNLRGGLTFGLDYFLAKGIYVGCQVDPFSYTYNMTSVKPQEGLSDLSADSHNYSIMSAPTIKIGFKF